MSSDRVDAVRAHTMGHPREHRLLRASYWAMIDLIDDQVARMLEALEATGQHRDDVYCENYNAKPWHKDPSAHATCVRTRTHKLVVVHGLEEGELVTGASNACMHLRNTCVPSKPMVSPA